MKEDLYRNLQQKMVILTLAVSLAPLLILGMVLYNQFERTGREMTREQIRYRAQAQAEAVDLFLEKRTAILNVMADTHSFTHMVQEENLASIFEIMNNRGQAFVDLGIIDSRGNHRAYIGPYDLRGRNYLDQPWFNEVLVKGWYKSDAYMGFRQQPHFIIAVRRYENKQPWILRATIDSIRFEEILRSAQIGRTGDAFIINRDGLYQTRSRFEGNVLGPSAIDPEQFGGGCPSFQCVIGTVMSASMPVAGSKTTSGCWL
jgi:two-component system NtrC family sensor kinase